MEISWKQYQFKAANFFKGLGLTASVEHQIEGARGIHKIDVFVEGDINGIPFKWVIECKDWKSNIPKEKVLTLASILSDIGADRAFLLSENGFQSGAIRIAKNTNITLCSLAELNQVVKHEAIIGRLNWRLQKARNRLRKIKKELFEDFYPMIRELGELSILESVLEDALQEKYPFKYNTEIEIGSFEQLVSISESVLKKAEEWRPPTEG